MDWLSYLPLLFSLGLGLVAGLTLGVAIWSLRWPFVKGRIEASFVDKESDWDDESGANATSVYQKESESLCLAYSYEVNAVRYMSGNVKPWGNSDWSLTSGGGDWPGSGKILWSGARDDAKWYRPDAVVDVYYCPQRPQWACLEPGGFLIPFLLGAAATATYLLFVR